MAPLRLVASAFVALAMIFSSQGARATVEPAAAVDAALAAYDREDSPSVSVGVYSAGKVVYARAVGSANLDYAIPSSTQTVSNVASLSKQFTAFAIALLERDGKIDPNADIRTYLPETPDFGAPVTVNDLIYHTSGLRDTNIILNLAQRDPAERIKQDQIVRLVEQQRSLRFKPGTNFSYTNTGYILLAEIVRRVSGQSLRQFTTERIFKPLGMTHTFFRDDATAIIPNWSDSYVPRPGGGWRKSLYSAEDVGSTGLATTTDDLLKWVANFDHPVVGDAALIDQISRSGKLRSGAEINYGYGLWRQRYAGREAVTHNGAIAGYRSLIIWLPKERFGVVVIANMPVDVGTIGDLVIEAYLGKASAPDPAQAARKEDAAPIAMPQAKLDELVGRYTPTSLWSVDLVTEGGKLYWTSTTLPKAEITLRERDIFSRGQGDNARWFQFTRDAKGRVDGFRTLADIGGDASGDVFRRAPFYTAPLSALKELEGDYHVREVDTTYTFFVKDGRLAARSLWGASDAKLVSVAPDKFDTDQIGLGVLEVVRNAAKRPVGFKIVGGGLAGMTMQRTPTCP